jgi:hypothetical protein
VEELRAGQTSAAETERMMKVQDVILKALGGRLKWPDAAGIIGISWPQPEAWPWCYWQYHAPGCFSSPAHI